MDLRDLEPFVMRHEIRDLLAVPGLLREREFHGQVLPHLVSQPHELELREEELHGLDEEIHGVDVDEGVVLHVAVLHFDGHLTAALGQGGPVHLGQARRSQRLLVETRKQFLRLKKRKKKLSLSSLERDPLKKRFPKWFLELTWGQLLWCPLARELQQPDRQEPKLGRGCLDPLYALRDVPTNRIQHSK